ncbi:hypothetical protein ABE26_21425 [Cytobacillus firmus]|nr:DUF1819 family protein [Cytobacillus firmus]MBG9589520.1 hypothetical protein [Cytobacillus firmus]
MRMELEYSSVLTGASFMLYEFKQVVMLKEQGYSDQEIRKKIITENLFQYEKISSLKRGLPSILRRVNVLDETFRKLVIKESFEVGKIINLYAIMKTDRLFFEFMDEVIKEKLQTSDYIFEKKDLNTYFTVKAEQNENIASWTESTVQKLKQVYLKILFNTGILKDKRSGELNRLMIDNRISDHLTHIGDANFVSAMGE